MDQPSKRSTFRRLALGAALGVGGLLVLGVFGLLLLLHSLDAAPVKGRLRALLRQRTGIDLDYGELRLSLLSGIALRDLRVAQPEPYAGLAPDLLRVGSVDVSWSLLGRPGPLRDIVVKDLALALVLEEDGGGSLDRLLRAGPAAPKVPLSRMLAEAVPRRAPFRSARIEDCSVTLIQRRAGVTVQTVLLTDFGAVATARQEGGATALGLRIGEPPAELRLTVKPAEGAEREARLALRMDIEATSKGRGRAGGLLEVRRQDLVPALPAGALLEFALEAEARPQDGRTDLRLQKLSVLDGALRSELVAELMDGPPAGLTVRSAAGALDLVRLAPLLPPELGTLALREGRLGYRVDGLEIGAAAEGVRFARGGGLQVDGRLAEVDFRGPGLHARLDRAEVTGRGDLDPEQRARMSVRLPLGDLLYEKDAGPGRPPELRVRARRGELELRLDKAGPLPQTVTGYAGEARLSGKLAALLVERRGLQVSADDLGLDLHAHLSQRSPDALELRAPIGRLAVRGRRKAPLLPPVPVRLELGVDALFPQDGDRRYTDFRLRLGSDLGPNRITATATVGKRAEFRVDASSRGLGLLGAVVPAAALGGLAVPWERMTLELHSQGTLDPSTRVLDQCTTLRLGNPAVAQAGGRGAAAEHVQATLASRGTGRRHEGTLDLQFGALRIDRQQLGDSRLGLKFGFDMAQPSLKLSLDGRGGAGPEGTLALDARYEKARQALRWEVDAHLSRLGPLAAAAPELSWSRLGVELKSRGEVQKLVRRFDAGVPTLSPDPLRDARGEGTLDLRLTGARYADGQQRKAELPELVLGARATLGEERRSGELRIEAPRLRAALGEEELAVEGLRARATLLGTGDPVDGDASGELTLTTGATKHNLAPLYPAGDLNLVLKVEKTDGAVRVSRFRFDNPRGGTTLSMSGGLDLTARGPARERVPSSSTARGRRVESLQERLKLVVGRRSLALSGSLQQRLDPLRAAGARPGAEELLARGRAGIDFQVESADLQVFHLAGLLKLEDATIRLPRERIALEGFDGQIPVLQDLLVDEGGRIVRLGDVRQNAFWRIRFTDHHPYLSGQNFLAISRVTVGDTSFGPVKGNLRLDRNLYSIDQLEVLLRDGKVRGQLTVDYRGEDTEVDFRGGATHVRPAQASDRNEWLDASAALGFALRRRSLEGRAEIIRIGRRQLLELLDITDPYHADPGTNRIRLALKVGYPRRVRLRFEQGFGSFLVELGGLTSFVRIDEVRGVPMGPIIERYLGRYLDPLLPVPAPVKRPEEVGR